MRTLAALLALSISAVAQPPVLRPSPEFKIVDPSGREILLSSLKGKVVILTFISTTCPHCQAASVMFTKLNREYAAKGLQVLGVAFNDNAKVLVDGFVQQFGIGYPVGYSNTDTVLGYMGFSMMDRWVYPQIVVIDRKGMIRAQSPPRGDMNLTSEGPLRALIEGLLAEGSPTSTTKKATPGKKAS